MIRERVDGYTRMLGLENEYVVGKAIKVLEEIEEFQRSHDL